MANPNPPEKTRFKKGMSGNAGGRPKLSPELKAIKALTSEEYIRTISKHLRKNKKQLLDTLQDANSTVLDMVICSTFAKVIKDGDIYRAECMFTRMLGKVTDKVEVLHPEPVVIEKSDGVQIELGVKDE